MPPSPVDLCQVPAGTHPDGRPSNFDNPTSLVPATIAVLSILTAWSIIFTSGRIYANFRKLTLSDYFAFIALAMGVTILCLEALQMRVMRHIWDTPACYFDAKFAQGVYYPAIILNIGQFFAKASILLIFSQIFTVQKIMRYTIYAGHVANFAIYGSGFAVATYYETPRPGESWMDTLDGRMSKPIKWWQAQSALAVVLDFYIFVLPLRPLWKLNLPIRRRISVIAVFSLALMGIGTSIASLVERVRITNSIDQTWISAILSLCSAVELNVAIIVSSAPGFASFTRSHVPGLSSAIGTFFSTNSRTRNSGAALAILDNQSAKSDQSRSAASAQHQAAGKSHPYYELEESWNSTTAKGGNDVNGHGNGIVRTTLLNQQIGPASRENLATHETSIRA